MLDRPVAAGALLMIIGLGLGVFIPTDNATIMTAIPALTGIAVGRRA